MNDADDAIPFPSFKFAQLPLVQVRTAVTNQSQEPAYYRFIEDDYVDVCL
jgi:hypothetical protein